MMTKQFNLTINMDNDAFEENGGRNELSRILHREVMGVIYWQESDGATIRDVNGNAVGAWSISTIDTTKKATDTCLFIEGDDVALLRQLGRKLYGNGPAMTGDERRDLANALDALLHRAIEVPSDSISITAASPARG
jgi:hypothetical protein